MARQEHKVGEMTAVIIEAGDKEEEGGSDGPGVVIIPPKSDGTPQTEPPATGRVMQNVQPTMRFQLPRISDKCPYCDRKNAKDFSIADPMLCYRAVAYKDIMAEDDCLASIAEQEARNARGNPHGPQGHHNGASNPANPIQPGMTLQEAEKLFDEIKKWAYTNVTSALTEIEKENRLLKSRLDEAERDMATVEKRTDEAERDLVQIGEILLDELSHTAIHPSEDETHQVKIKTIGDLLRGRKGEVGSGG